MSENFFWAVVGMVGSIVLMIFELLFLTRWLERREERGEKLAWEPFRALLLGTIVRHLDELNAIGRSYIDDVGALLDSIRDAGGLTSSSLSRLAGTAAQLESSLRNSKQEFFFGIQTAAPSLKPEAAEYCGEAFYFGQTLEQYLVRANGVVSRLSELPDLSNDSTERLLSELVAIKLSIHLLLDFRFSMAKTNFVRYVWKQEQLHYFERDGAFYSPEEYRRALETEKSAAMLNGIPRTDPIKRFFDKEDEIPEPALSAQIG
ncbi:MAG TPA: hypothetical protein VFQ39_02330 [Longimicrobium sp.]|nr:hypothetical protein [Longimicrobium sp.]